MCSKCIGLSVMPDTPYQYYNCVLLRHTTCYSDLKRDLKNVKNKLSLEGLCIGN